MANGTTAHRTVAVFVNAMTERRTTVAQQLSDWSTRELPDLPAIEKQVLADDQRAWRRPPRRAPRSAPATTPCAGGPPATFQRIHAATSLTLLGPLTVARP